MEKQHKNVKAAATCLQFIHHLRVCLYLASGFVYDHPNSVFTPIFKLAIDKIKWVFSQFTTHHLLVAKVPSTIVEIQNKWDSDFSEELAVNEKITLLDEKQLVTLNELLDALILGEEINVEYINKEDIKN